METEVEKTEVLETEEQSDKKTGINNNAKVPVFLLGLCVGLLLGLMIMVGNTLLSHVRPSANGSITVYKGNGKILNKKIEDKIDLVSEFINRYYLEDVDATKMADGIYRGMVESIGDPYSTYYDADELVKINQSNKGMFYGVGLSLSQDAETMYITVQQVIKDTPADGSGIEPEDMLYAVDDEVIVGQNLSDVVLKVKGELGTEVKLTMYRDGEYMDYVFKRGEVKNETVTFEMMDDEIAYIRIGQFEQVTYEQFNKALEESEEKDAKGLIIDLRGNPGGDLITVTKIADQLLPKGMIVYTEDKQGAREEFRSDDEHQYNKPLVVLVDGASASASEILAGAIKDYGSGTLVGTQTFGKGIVQRILSLGDGTALKLTISNYYTPNGNNIHKVGIEPDVKVEFDADAYMKDKTDNQLNKALEIVKGK